MPRQMLTTSRVPTLVATAVAMAGVLAAPEIVTVLQHLGFGERAAKAITAGAVLVAALGRGLLQDRDQDGTPDVFQPEGDGR